MAVVHILAHFDDEYFAVPLIRRRVKEGLDQRFLFVADYPSEPVSALRHAESRALLSRLGVDPSHVLHVGAGTGALNGAVHRRLEAAFQAVSAAVSQIAQVARFVVPAWEGGHMDHDMCALMAAVLSRKGAIPIDQFSLYHGKGLGRPFFHGGAPLPENGPVTRVGLSAAEWVAWMGLVRFYPSQAKTWAGHWPATFWTYARRGFGYQQLDPARITERPHEGRLYYERMFRTPYEEVRAAADAFLQARA